MGRLSEKSFRDVPKSEVTPMPIAIIPRITITIAPAIGIPLERNFKTSGLAMTDKKIASKKVIEQVVSLVEKKSQEFKNN